MMYICAILEGTPADDAEIYMMDSNQASTKTFQRVTFEEVYVLW